MTVDQCQVAGDPKTKPTNLVCESTCRCYCLHSPALFRITQAER